MPDQSLSNDAVSGNTSQEVGDPSDTTANSPSAATPESLESNVTRASTGETTQAAQTINGDPVASTGDVQTAGADEYDDDEVWPFRKLQTHAKEVTGDGSGKRDEIVARLRAHASGGVAVVASSDNLGAQTTDADPAGPVPTAPVDPTNVINGGIQQTSRGQEHAEVLQGLSQERRQQQLAAVASRSAQSESDEE